MTLDLEAVRSPLRMPCPFYNIHSLPALKASFRQGGEI